MKRFRSLMYMLFLLCVAPVLAQSATCPDIVSTALEALDQHCSPTERNQACLGNIRLDVTAQPDATDFHFEDVGDIENVIDIETLRLYPMDEDEATWGVALMRLQANLPDTLPGQNVTFLLFGDVELTNNGGDTPMQSMYLATGIGDAACNEAPNSGLLVQTPNGAGQITFSVNGVDISAGSTVYFSGAPGEEMRIDTLEGGAVFYIEDESYPIIEGTYVETDLSEDFEPEGDPNDPEPYEEEDFEWLPEDLLGQQFDVQEPLTDEEIQQLLDLIEAGEPLCDNDDDTFLPACEHLPVEYGGAECTFDPINEYDLPFCQLQNLGDDGDSDGDGYLDSEDFCPFYGDYLGSGVDEWGCPYLSPDEDLDFDGYNNSVDFCPYVGNIYGDGVDGYGCPILPPYEDMDFDGYYNAQDFCPYEGDTYGMGVDVYGCPILPPDEDADFDGYLNNQDFCPFEGDTYGQGIDQFGCPILPPDDDPDFDGFPNSQDSCPFEGDTYGQGVDQFGCPILPAGTDSDGDGYADVDDYCPSEGDTYGYGIDGFGCPVPPPDADSDGDGYLDSQDSCPLEANTYGYGIDQFGCPIQPPVDSDGDGYHDSIDSCPFDGDVNGTGVDGSGCPNPPPDSDGDGYADSTDSCPFEGDVNGTGVDGSGCPNPP